MAIPQIATFEGVLASCLVEQPQDTSGYERITVIEATSHSGTQESVDVAERAIWFKSNESLSFDSLVTKVEKELATRKHKATTEIAIAVLALFALLRKPNELAVGALNRFLSWIVEANVFQTYIFPQKTQHSPSLRIGPFQFQTLDRPRLRSRCEKAGSNHFEIAEKQLRDRFSIDRDVFRTNVIDWYRHWEDDLQQSKHPNEFREVHQAFTSLYFHTISQELLKDFLSSFLESQHLLIAAGGPYFPETSLVEVKSEILTLFLDMGPKKTGFVTAASARRNLSLEDLHVRVPVVQNMLNEEYGFTEFSETDTHQTLRTYSLFMSKAQRHYLEGRKDEGFLHWVIALDLVFGEKDASTKSVCRRVACITHRVMETTFDEQVKKLGGIYDKRSRYVHQGSPVGETDIADVLHICREVLWCLLRFQKVSEGAVPISKWLSEIDFFVAAMEANREIDENQWHQCGIATAANGEKTQET